MELKPDFAFTPIPSIDRPLRFSSVHSPDNPLGLLADLKGTWTGAGFNVIWRPNSKQGQDRFLELNLTEETLRFEEIPGPIPNRGLLQPDINMFGLWYLQTIADANIKENGKPAGLHLEPGIWATVPQTDHPQEVPISTEAVAARRHAGPHLPAIGWNNTTGNSQLALAA